MQTLRGAVLALSAVLLCTTLAPGARADQWDKKTIVTFGEDVQIPGQVLPREPTSSACKISKPTATSCRFGLPTTTSS
jgi:hypothetical protein